MLIDDKFIAACRSGDIETAKQLMSEPLCNPSVKGNLALKQAALCGHSEIINLLLSAESSSSSSRGIDPAAGNNYALKAAAENGHEMVVKALLNDSRVDPAAKGVDGIENYALRIAAEKGYHQIVKLLLSQPNVDPTAKGQDGAAHGAIRIACDQGHTKVVELLLSDWRVDLGDQTLTALTATATEKGHSDIVKLLQRLARLKSPLQQTSRLTMPEDFRSRSGSAASASASASASAAKSPRLSSASPSPISQNHPSSIANPSTTSSLLTKQEEDLKTVILKGGDESIETVRRLLLTVNPASDNNAALSVACAAGHLIITRLLLSDIRVDPSDNDNDAIRMAASRGQVEVVRLLLSHPRVDPAACDNAAIRLACAGGYLQVVDLLLSDSRVDPTAESNNAIRVAAEAGNEGIVRRLLADARIDPAAKENYAIVLASFKGHTQVVWLLLSDARVDPAANDNAAIRFAAANGNADVVKLLLGSLRINPTAMKNIATRAACEKGHVKVVEMLLSDALVDPSIELLESLLNIATQNGHSELVKILQRFTKVKATEMKQEGKRRRGSSNSAACESISSPAKKAQQSEVLPVNAVAKVSSIPDNKNSSNNKNAAVALTHGKAVLKEKLDLLDNLEKMRLEKVLEAERRQRDIELEKIRREHAAEVERKDKEARMEREVLQQQMRSMMEMMQSLNKQISATTIITSDTLPPSFAANDREGSPFVSLPSTISSQGLVPIHSNPDDDPENPFRPVNEHNDRHSSTRDSKSHHENNEKGHPVPQPQFFEPPPAYDNDADGQDLQDRIYSIMPSAPPLDNH